MNITKKIEPAILVKFSWPKNLVFLKFEAKTMFYHFFSPFRAFILLKEISWSDVKFLESY